MTKAKNRQDKLYGSFEVAEGRQVFGDVRLKGRSTTLTLMDQEGFEIEEGVMNFFGTSLPGRKISCIDCILSSMETIGRDANAVEMFPHFIVVGSDHIHPTEEVVSALSFTTTDLKELFYDPDAFGVVPDPKPLMDAILSEARQRRPVEVGDRPEVHYYTGKAIALDVDTCLGNIIVVFERTTRISGVDGPQAKNDRRLILTLAEPITFKRAMDHLNVLRRFLSFSAGRPQKIDSICVRTTAQAATQMPMKVHWSHAPKGPIADRHKPSAFECPLDPIRRPEEYSTAIQAWLANEPNMRVARARYMGCMHKGDLYDIDRMVAAANMFDLLPRETCPQDVVLTPEMTAFREMAMNALVELPKSYERDRIKGDLSRLVKPSLTQKVLHRWSMASKDIPDLFPEMEFVLKQAVKCRNFFVHGGGDFKYDQAEPFIFFLTDALEFVFAFSDMVESGWCAKQWNTRGHSDGHTFSRFRWMYPETLKAFKAAMEK